MSKQDPFRRLVNQLPNVNPNSSPSPDSPPDLEGVDYTPTAEAFTHVTREELLNATVSFTARTHTDGRPPLPKHAQELLADYWLMASRKSELMDLLLRLDPVLCALLAEYLIDLGRILQSLHTHKSGKGDPT